MTDGSRREVADIDLARTPRHQLRLRAVRSPQHLPKAARGFPRHPVGNEERGRQPLPPRKSNETFGRQPQAVHKGPTPAAAVPTPPKGGSGVQKK